jgi:hypothetical protein
MDAATALTAPAAGITASATTAGVAAASATASWEASAHSSASTAAAPLLALLSGGDRDLFGPRRVGQYFGDFLARPLGVVFGFPKIGR